MYLQNIFFKPLGKPWGCKRTCWEFLGVRVHSQNVKYRLSKASKKEVGGNKSRIKVGSKQLKWVKAAEAKKKAKFPAYYVEEGRVGKVQHHITSTALKSYYTFLNLTDVYVAGFSTLESRYLNQIPPISGFSGWVFHTIPDSIWVVFVCDVFGNVSFWKFRPTLPSAHSFNHFWTHATPQQMVSLRIHHYIYHLC